MEKKVVFITGTNSGFGYLTAKGAAERGYTVYASMRNTDSRNAERAAELNAIENINVVELDVTNGEQVKTVLSDVINKEGRIDVLVMFAAKVYKVASSKRVLPPGLIWSVNIGTDIVPPFIFSNQP